MQPPSKISATAFSRMATSSPKSRHLTFLTEGLHGGTNLGGTPNAAQNATREERVRFPISNKPAAVVASETAWAAADSTTACRLGYGMDVFRLPFNWNHSG